MLLVLERFFQQSWHTIIQPSSLWLAPRVLMSVPALPQSAHVPMLVVSGWVTVWMVIKVSPGGLCYSKLEKYI
jgi:hypothetical protein